MGETENERAKGLRNIEFLGELKSGYTTQTFIVEKSTSIKSRWSGEIEESRKSFVHNLSDWFVTVVIANQLIGVPKALAKGAEQNVDKIREGFDTILDVFTALAEPILWFYALTACILIATKNKDTGINRLKQVAYAYTAIALLPTFFALIRWVAELIKGAVQFS